MKLLHSLLALALVLGAYAGKAQMIEDPTTWKYEVKKKSATEYQLIFHLDLKAPWHIWAIKPGGDGFQISPSFTFEDYKNIKLKGAPVEKGKPTTTKMEGVDGKVTYYSGKVDYIQDVVVTDTKTALKIKGTHGYQVCNDKMCLPP
jgi:hypothetical protein